MNRKIQSSFLWFAPTVSIFFLMFTPSYAADGTVDILPDGKSPLVILNPGSYVLVGDVTSETDKPCIDIRTNDVTIDLNGHSITGPGKKSGSNSGITGQHRIRIKNGRISGFGLRGIELWDEARIEDVMVTDNGFSGILVEDNAALVRITALRNMNYGVKTGEGALVKECVIEGNNLLGGCGGIYVKDGSIVKDCTCHNNSTVSPRSGFSCGIYALNRCTLSNNVCTSNTNDSSQGGYVTAGIMAGSFCHIENNICVNNHLYGSNLIGRGILAESNCTIVHNNCSKNFVYGDGSDVRGIECTDHCLVEYNLANKNSAEFSVGGDTGAGILANSYCTIRGNKCHDNRGKSMDSVGIRILGDYCRVESNHCTHHSSDVDGYGILVRGNNNVISGNVTSENQTKGISLLATGNYCAENMVEDEIQAVTGNTLGTDDRSNVSF